MPDKNDLDNMAKRYKEEMLRLYRKNPVPSGNTSNTRPAAPPAAPASAEAVSTPAAVVCGEDGCRFISPEEIISNEKQNVSFSDKNKERKDLNYGSDITSALIDGTGFSPQNLVTAEIAGCTVNCSDNDIPGRSQLFEGILLRNVYTSPVTSAESKLTSDVYSEVIPDILRFPPDAESTSSVPMSLDISYAISDRWKDLTGDGGWGYVRFELFTGTNDSPIKGATVVISRRSADRTVLSRIISSGKDGVTPAVALPAPAEKQSSGCTPYALYSAMIFANGYYPVYDMKLKVYPGITTVFPVRLAKLPENTDITYAQNE